MKVIILFPFLLFTFQIGFSQKVFHTSNEYLSIFIDDKLQMSNWRISPEINPDIYEVECRNTTQIVSFKDDKDSINFIVSLGQIIDFDVVTKQDTAKTRIIGVKPNVNFTPEYMAKYKNKTFVEIPEVSELVNILMALHKDAEKEDNMFDIHTDYYRKVKEYFKPYLNHPALDTIQKYINNIHYLKEDDMNMFSNESYGYYYALKMNACNYEFNENDSIYNTGYINEMAKGYYYFDPMKDKSVFADFARKSNFRQFYKENKAYYDSLIVVYNELNPVQKMQSWLDKKFKFGYDSYIVYFSPLIYGAHSTQHFEQDGFKQTFMFICRAEKNSKYIPIMNEMIESRVVFTEIDHNYVNPISDKYINEINQSFSNRNVWAASEIADNYRNPYLVFNEYMTFAVYSLYLLDNYPESEVIEYLPKMEKQMTNSRGFIKFKEFNQKLIEKYKENPNQPITDLYSYILLWANNENQK